MAERGTAAPPPEASEPGTLLGVDRRVFALAVARMADALGNSFLIVVLPLYIASGQVTGRAMGLSEAFVTGLVLALFGVVNSVVQPFAGRLSDRTGRRRVFIVGGLVVLGAATFTFELVSSYAALFAVRLVQGVAAAFTITATVALINELSDARRRGGNMGLYNALRLVGFGAGPLAAGLLVHHGPYALPGGHVLDAFQVIFAGAAGAAFVSAGLVMLLVEDPPETQPSAERVALRVWADGPGRGLDPIFALGVATFTMSYCFALLAPIETIVNARLDQGPVWFSIEFAALIATLAVVQPVVGRASDRRGRLGFILVGFLGLVPTTLVQGFVTAPWELVGARALQGLFAACIFAPALALAGDLAEEGQSGAQLSVLTVAFGVGIAAGQIASGFLVRYGFATPFAVGATVAVAGGLLVYTQVREAQPVAP